MSLRIKIVTFVICIAMLLLIVDLVRRRKLREEYSQLWFATWLGILILMVWFDLLKWVSHLIGAVSTVSTLFLFAFMFLILISLHFSVVISKLTDKIKDLSQRT
jgi:tellurite resistance protein TehA-like permease